MLLVDFPQPGNIVILMLLVNDETVGANSALARLTVVGELSLVLRAVFLFSFLCGLRLDCLQH